MASKVESTEGDVQASAGTMASVPSVGLVTSSSPTPFYPSAPVPSTTPTVSLTGVAGSQAAVIPDTPEEWADMEGMVLTEEQMKQNGYTVRQLGYTDLFRMRRCKICRARVCSKAVKNKRKLPPKAKKEEDKRMEVWQAERKKDSDWMVRQLELLKKQGRGLEELAAESADNPPPALPHPPMPCVEPVIPHVSLANNKITVTWPFPFPHAPGAYNSDDSEDSGDKPRSLTVEEHLLEQQRQPEVVEYNSHIHIGLEEDEDTIYHQVPLTTIQSALLLAEMEHDKQLRLDRAICQGHPGKVRQSRYTCCNRSLNSRGCHRSEQHGDAWEVHDIEEDFELFETPGLVKNARRCIALDCEMGINQIGEPEIIRVSAVDYFTGETLLNSLVWPKVEMLHLNTRYSGVTWPMLYHARQTHKAIIGRDKARQMIWNFVGPETIVVAHAGRNDLLALRWIHRRVIDTLDCEARRLDPEKCRSLAHLASTHLKREIQESRFGHDSLEDAVASRDLVHWYVQNLPAVSKQRPEPIGLSDVYTETMNRIAAGDIDPCWEFSTL